GVAGNVQGGDRLPWFELRGTEGAAADNFVALENLQWQVHCYGEASAGVYDVCAAKRGALTCFPRQPRMEQAGLMRNALYVIRPDGYIGLADPAGKVATLQRYLEKHGIRSHALAGPATISIRASGVA